jgi:hypothetical protein
MANATARAMMARPKPAALAFDELGTGRMLPVPVGPTGVLTVVGAVPLVIGVGVEETGAVVSQA